MERLPNRLDRAEQGVSELEDGAQRNNWSISTETRNGTDERGVNGRV